MLVDCEETFDQIMHLVTVGQVRELLFVWEYKFAGRNFLKHVRLTASSIERDVAKHKFEDNDTNGPPIHREPVPSLLDNFGRHIGWCAGTLETDGAVFEFSRQPKVNEFDVSVLIYQDIFQLKISVRDAQFMEVANAEHNLGHIKFDFFFRQILPFSVIFVKFRSSHKRHDKVDS
jgi:hypothetical protein